MHVRHASLCLQFAAFAALFISLAMARDATHFHPFLRGATRMLEQKLNASTPTSRTIWTGPSGGTSAFHAGVERVEEAAYIPAHAHDVEEILVVISGSAQLVAGDGIAHALEAHSVVAVPAGKRHEIRNTGQEPLWLFWAFPNSANLFAFRQEYPKSEL